LLIFIGIGIPARLYQVYDWPHRGPLAAPAIEGIEEERNRLIAWSVIGSAAALWGTWLVIHRPREEA
jgi:hypothetical protein